MKKKQKLSLSKRKQCMLAIVISTILLALFMPIVFKSNLGGVFLGLVVLSIFYCDKVMALFAGSLFVIVIVYMRFIMRRIEGLKTKMTPETDSYLSIVKGKVVASSPIASNTGAAVPMIGLATPQIWTKTTQDAIVMYGAKKYPQSTTFASVFTKRYNTATNTEVMTYLKTDQWPWTSATTDNFKRAFLQFYTKNGGAESTQTTNIMNSVILTSKAQLTNANAEALVNNLDMYSIWVQYIIYLAKGGKA